MKRVLVGLLALVVVAIVAFAIVLVTPIASLVQVRSKETAMLYHVGVPDAWLWAIGVIPYDYPLGPFARVQHWGDVFSNTNDVRVQTINGRLFYDFMSNPGGGFLDLDGMAVGPTRVAGQWIAAIPLVSGGSGGVFQVAVFKSDGFGQPQFVGVIADGDSTTVTMRDGLLNVSVPYRAPDACMACYDETTINQYAVTPSGLSRVGQRVLPIASNAWRNEQLDVVPASSVAATAKRVLDPDGSPWEVHLPQGLVIPSMPTNGRALVRSRLGPANTFRIADAVFAYHGGLDK